MDELVLMEAAELWESIHTIAARVSTWTWRLNRKVTGTLLFTGAESSTSDFTARTYVASAKDDVDGRL